MIAPGDTSHLRWVDRTWIFLDIGFSSQRPSCGLLFGEARPECVQFWEAKQRILERVVSSPTQVGLVIEAPLSVCFGSNGNPKGRRIEKEGTKHRYWYENLGCQVMVAAMYIVREIHDANAMPIIHLFEGFVSFKDRSERSNHLSDVCLLRDVVREPKRFAASIVTPDQLKSDPKDILESAFRVSGIDCGVPVVLKR